MSTKNLLSILIGSAIILLIILFMQPLEILYRIPYIDVLFPAGLIGVKQLDLLLIIQILMLFIIIPVYILTFAFSWIYRASSHKAKYDPHLSHSTFAEGLWWGIPLVMTIIVASITVIRTFELDPYKPIESDKPEKVIQVVATQWNWLFIYPEEKIASINYLQFPKDVPLHFEITADAPMNSFWIPKLGGQIYAMPKMKTELYLIANEEGDFLGRSANISGEGFANMQFVARASSEEEYQQWIQKAQASSEKLQWEEYQKIAKPQSNYPLTLYQLEDSELFNRVLMKFMLPPKEG